MLYAKRIWFWQVKRYLRAGWTINYRCLCDRLRPYAVKRLGF